MPGSDNTPVAGFPVQRGGNAMPAAANLHFHGVLMTRWVRTSFRVLPITALAVFLAMAGLVQWLRKDLSPRDAQMSMYLFGPWGHALQAAYVVLGAGMLLLAAGIHLSLQVKARSGAVLLLFTLAAAALSVTAFARMDVGQPMVSLPGIVHGVAAQATFLCASTALLMLGWRMREDNWWALPARWIRPWAALCFGLTWTLGLTPDLPRGLAQKLVILVLSGLLLALSVVLRDRLRD